MSHLTLDVQTAAGSTAGQVELPAEIFDREVSISLLHQVVNAQLAINLVKKWRKYEEKINCGTFIGSFSYSL